MDKAPTGKAPAALPPINEATFGKAHASPSVRRFARELGVNLAQVTGTGRKARVLKDDVQAFVKAVMSGQPATGSPTAGPGWPRRPDVGSGLFGEIGNSGAQDEVSDGDASAKLNAIAKRIQTEGKADTFAKAYTLAMDENPNLVTEIHPTPNQGK